MTAADTTTATMPQSSPTWVVFSCAFPSSRSTPRVAVWRRLRRSGAVALKSGLYVLPATDECVEAMRWLAQEARDEGADPIIIRAETIDGVSETQIVELFHEARREDYAELLVRANDVEAQLRTSAADTPNAARLSLERLRADFQQVRRIDYFDAPEGRHVATRLDALTGVLAAPSRPEPVVPPRAVDDYRGRSWITRPRPFVDRLACLWLIRRFIDPAATIRYAAEPAEHEVAFDMSVGEFQHVGNRCTFEVMVETFALADTALRALGEIVHEIDLHDGRYARPEVAGVEAVLVGWRDVNWADEILEAAGLALFDGIFASLRPEQS